MIFVDSQMPTPVRIVERTKAVNSEILAPSHHPTPEKMNVKAVVRIPFTVGSLGQEGSR